jgi:hypothetical protein
MKRSVPPKLYKYQSYNVQTLDNLKNRSLWFSKPAQFNDPFDHRVIPFEMADAGPQDWTHLYNELSKANAARGISLPYSGPTEEFKAKVKTGYQKAYEERVKRLQERGVACFSAKVDDILMWSHYADGHRGFCLEFDAGYEPFSKALPVIYSDAFPALNLSDGVVKDVPDLLVTNLTTKSSCWSYEQEWRVFHLEGNQEHHFEAASLTGIYFGCEMPFVHQEVIARTLAGSPTHLYTMKLSGTKFTVEAEMIK